ncbi:MAG: PHB depolymerase family esterase [Rhizobacter sp.]|nr:PHB depolymerase family esterase [Rhizobacter sp.]
MDSTSSFASLMAQATTLTRQGRVAEATQAIRRALGLRRAGDAAGSTAGDAAPAAPRRLEGVVLEGLVRELETPATDLDTPPPSPAHRPARFDALPFATAQGLRHYKLFTPAGLPESPAPLVVMLHGCKQNPDDFAAGTRMNELAQAHGFRVLYPAQAPRSNMSRCWNWFQPGDQSRGRGEPALLAGMVRQVMGTHAVDTSRIYIAGLSAGGAMTAIMAHEYPDLFAAAGVHSGLPQGAAHDVASAFAAMKHGPKAAATQAVPVPLIVFHGDHDETVHPSNGERLVPGLSAGDTETGASAGGHTYTRTVQRDDQGRSRVEHWLVQGLGHAWSGGSPAGSYTAPRGPDASGEMLRFFMQHRRG